MFDLLHRPLTEDELKEVGTSTESMQANIVELGPPVESSEDVLDSSSDEAESAAPATDVNQNQEVSVPRRITRASKMDPPLATKSGSAAKTVSTTTTKTDSATVAKTSSTAAAKTAAAKDNKTGAKTAPTRASNPATKPPVRIALPFTGEERALLAKYFLIAGHVTINVDTLNRAMKDATFASLYKKIDGQTGGNERRAKQRIRSALRKLGKCSGKQTH